MLTMEYWTSEVKKNVCTKMLIQDLEVLDTIKVHKSSQCRYYAKINLYLSKYGVCLLFVVFWTVHFHANKRSKIITKNHHTLLSAVFLD